MQTKEIIILGDIAFNGIISTEPEKNIERYKEIIPVFSKAGMVFANLEVPLKVDETRNEFKKFIHFSLQEPTEQLLKMLNIGCVSLANNHIYDCKMPGLKATIQLLDKLGIYHTGAGWLPEHIEPVIIPKNGKRIGFLAYVDKKTNPKTEKFTELYINYFNLENVLSDIKKLKGKVDKIIVSVHWGVDYSHYQTLEQVNIAHKLIDIGADIIMGHHTHTIQSVEYYKKNGIIFYSLGQLCFGDFIWEGKLGALKRKTKLGMMAVFRDYSFKEPYFIPTYESQNNIISIPNINLNKKLIILRELNKLKNKYSVVNFIINIKEIVFDRIFEYFFGYYRNPYKQIISFKNIGKISYFKRDFSKISKKNR